MKRILVGIVIIFIVFINIIYLNNENHYTIRNVDYNGDNLMISIDGNSSSTLPTSGKYYLASYDCESDETKISWDNINYELKVSNSSKKSGVSCYLDFQTNPLLYYMEVGSYVKYRKTDDCADDDASCRWYNANYVNDTNLGYCGTDNSFKFITNGWRIGYKANGSVYLISAGSPECMCTDSNGNFSNSSCSDYDVTDGAVNHLKNLNLQALNYCREEYIKNGVCSSDTVWTMNSNDFNKITGTQLYYNSNTDNSCSGSASNMDCGYNNDLIDNGGYYWIASPYNSSSSSYMFYWNPVYRSVNNDRSDYMFGLRPVLYLESSVVVTGGSGTYEDPYTIGNNTFNVDETSLVSNGNSRNVTLNLVVLDTVDKVCVNVDSSCCSNYVNLPENNIYNLDLSSYGVGEKTIYVYYKNASGKIVASMHKTVTLS